MIFCMLDIQQDIGWKIEDIRVWKYLRHDSKAEFSGILKDLYDAYKEIVG